MEQTYAEILKYGRGQIYLKTLADLRINSAEKTEIQKENIEKTKFIKKEDKKITKKINEQDQQTLNKLSVGPFDTRHDRRATDITAVGTIYGRAQTWTTDVMEHSASGINVACLTTEGTIKTQQLIDYMKRINPVQQVREARINDMFNNVIVKEGYENYLLLGLNAYVQIELMDMYKKTEVSELVVELTTAELKLFSDEDEYSSIRTWLKQQKQFGCEPTIEIADYIFTITESIRKLAYRSEVPQRVWTFKVPCFTMFEYTQGHAQFQNSGEVCGFINDKYICYSNRFKFCPDYDRIKPMKDWTAMSETELTHYGATKFIVNAAGFSVDDIYALMFLMDGNTRCSPFLIDQTFEVGQSRDEWNIGILNCPVFDRDIEEVTINQGMISSFVRKFLTSHRCHEDFLAAKEVLHPWVAQPAGDTIESYQWLYLKRRQRLPKLGMRRAAFRYLLEGDAAAITQEAISVYRETLAKRSNLAFYSLQFNTFWYWGEYLLLVNKDSNEGLVRAQLGELGYDVKVDQRAYALISAVTGEQVKYPTCSGTAIYIEEGIESYKHIELPLQVPGVQNLSVTGYTVRNNRTSFHQTVAPGSIAIVLGHVGTLIASTPLSARFGYSPCTYKILSKKRVIRNSYHDLWAMSVWNRWQGYDTYYCPPGTKTMIKSFATNNVGIALPPEGYAALDESANFTINRVEERERSWGVAIDKFNEYQFIFTWSKSNLRVMSEPRFKSDEAPLVEFPSFSITGFSTTTSTLKHYRAYVTGEYLLDESDFRAALIRISPNAAQIMEDVRPAVPITSHLEMTERVTLEPITMNTD